MEKQKEKDIDRLVTARMRRENKIVELPDGSKVRVNDLRLQDDSHADVYFDLYDLLYEEVSQKNQAPHKTAPSSAKPKSSNKPHEVKIGEQVDALEKEVEQLRSKLRKKEFSREIWDEIDTKTAALADLKDRRRKEQFVKESKRRQFLENSFGTEEDFERLWESTLRDQAILRHTEDLDAMRRASRHSIYSMI